MSNELNDIRTVSAGLIDEAKPALTADTLPSDVTTSFVDFATNVRAAIDAADQFVADKAELDGKKALLPPSGYQMLEGQAYAEAKSNRDEAYKQAQQAHERLVSTLTDAAMPQVNGEREALARNEVELAMNRPGSVEGNAIRIAGSAGREALAALLSPFGQMLLESKGLEGADLANVMADVRQVAAKAAAEHGQTERERAAAEGLVAAERAKHAIGASSVYVDDVLKARVNNLFRQEV